MLVIYTIDPCSYCDLAKEYGLEYGYEIEERDFYAPSMWDWEVMTGQVPKTAPQIFVDDVYIGGCNEFINWLEES
jgi:glutaredoxin